MYSGITSKDSMDSGTNRRAIQRATAPFTVLAERRKIPAGRPIPVTLKPGRELLAEDLRQCQHHLGEITGAVSSDALLGRIFPASVSASNTSISTRSIAIAHGDIHSVTLQHRISPDRAHRTRTTRVLPTGSCTTNV